MATIAILTIVLKVTFVVIAPFVLWNVWKAVRE